MKDRSSTAWMRSVALLLLGARSLPCAAQQSAPSPIGSPAPAAPAAGPGADLGTTGLPPALPSPPPGPSPLASRPRLNATPFSPTDLRFPITLAVALRLADARPLVVAAAQARTWVAEAELTRAKVLWVPNLNFGFDYIRHDGGGPDFNKGIMTAPSVNFFYAGAGLTGPGVGLIPTTDAIYEPLVARQVLNSEHWGIQTAKNDAVLEVANAYFRVHQYRGTYAGALYTVARAHDVVQRVEALSRDLAQPFEVDRARNMLADLQQQAALARQQWQVESARLTQTLRLDPRAVVEPLEHDHAQITLVDPGRPLDDLMPVALVNRPEVASRRALVGAAEYAVSREKARPFIPSIGLNGFQTPNELIQGGIFAFGPNSSLNQWRGRFDLSIQPLWQLEGLGIGNLARIKAQRGLESLAIIDLFEAQDRVAAEVTAAHARAQASAVRVVQADRALRTGIITLNGTVEGLGQTSRFADVLNLVSRPQEAVYALQLLQRDLDEYFGTVSEYNRAQFELFRALGYPAAEVARVNPPGPDVPVDTARPPYLPPVGNGPPPATR